ncbi:hypothetical protein OQA88_5737 [Cercophora sp. LCS_1]
MDETDAVPTYTETDQDGLTTLIASIPSSSEILSLPLTTYPTPPPITNWFDNNDNISNPNVQSDDAPNDVSHEPTPAEIYSLQTRLISTLFTAIETKNTEIVTLLVTRGYLSPDIPNAIGETPLIASIIAGNGTMLCTLISLGATPNFYGRFEGVERTPLMVAAALGRLALVKLLREDFGADDGIIAPDGQLALRLAADRGHREVVDYLPVRRGGAWRRWKVHHEVAVRRIKAAGRNIYRFFKFFLWDVPRFFVWSCPKHLVVLPLYKGCKYCWENRGRFGGWCQRQVKALPGRVKRVGKRVWEGTKKMPGVVWRGTKAVGRFLTRVPGYLKRLAVWIWGVIKKIPDAMKTVAMWIWEWLKRAGIAVGNVFLKIVSAVHTAVMAVLDFFRSISLKDVWGGICAVFRAIFVELPAAIWSGILGAGKVARKVLEGLFGCVGLLIFYFFKGLIWVAQYVPMQLWAMICGIGSSMAKGYHEILVWFNPKH